MNTFQKITRRAIELTMFWLVIQLTFAGAVCAQCSTADGEFEVNGQSLNAQKNPSAAGLSQGGFVVTWQSYNQDGSAYGVYGQLFDTSGKPVGSEFPVNTHTNQTQANPSAAGLADGGFVVTWEGEGQDDPKGIYGQLFDSSGEKAGSEFQVNTYTTKTQANPSAAALSGGGFVVTWLSDGSDGGDNSIYSVQGQLFDSSGNKVGGEFQVNTYTNNSQGWPSAAGLSQGGFVVTWHGEGQEDPLGIYGQLFNSSGNKVGSEFPVNTHTTDQQYYPSVAALSGGGFVVTWMSNAQERGYQDVYGQVFRSSGSRVGSEFRVNTYSPGDQYRPSAAGLLGGGFVVAWESPQDGNGYGIYGQVFESSGIKVGDEFRVNTYTTNNQSWPSAAGLSGGAFVVAWESVGQDGSQEGIYGQRYSCPIAVFRDELIVDFGEIYGLWHYDREALSPWSLLNAVDPDLMTVVDMNGDGRDELAVTFLGNGLFTYDPIEDWQRINTVDPEMMIAADIDGDGKDELVAGFNGYGLYYYDQPGIWSDAPINEILPEAMLRYSDGVLCDFGTAHGLWSYHTSEGWVLLNSEDPDHTVTADIDGDGKDELVVSFVGWGLYTYEPEGSVWQRINAVIPDQIVPVDIDGDGNDELVVSFPGYGLYTFEPEGLIWQQPPINTVIPENMIRLNNGIACDFGAAHGLWTWTLTGGWRPRNDVDPLQMLSVDIDKDGIEDLVVSFSGYGLYFDDETIGWQTLNDVVPEEMKSINFRP